MDRKLYLEMCREVATLDGGIEDIKQKVPDRLRVTHNGYEFYPVAYELGFKKDGSVRHTAIIHELTANAVWHVELAKVEEKSKA